MGPGSRFAWPGRRRSCDSNFKQPSQLQIHVRIPAARCTRVLHKPLARHRRAWGMPGARCTRSLVCKVLVAHECSHHGRTGTPGIPTREWF